MDIPPRAGRLLGSGRTASNLNSYQRAQNATANSLRDIAGREDIVTLVQTFYLRAFADPLIGPIFTHVVPLDLAHHLPIMADFWQTVLFKAGLYNRNALQVHFEIDAKAPLTPEHFNRWLQLWGQSVDELFSGDKAELAKAAAHQIAGSMLRRVTGRQASAHSTISLRPPAG